MAVSGSEARTWIAFLVACGIPVYQTLTTGHGDPVLIGFCGTIAAASLAYQGDLRRKRKRRHRGRIGGRPSSSPPAPRSRSHYSSGDDDE